MRSIITALLLTAALGTPLAWAEEAGKDDAAKNAAKGESIGIEQLPKAVTVGFSQDHRLDVLKSARKLTHGDKTVYRLSYVEDGKKHQITYSEDGKPLRKPGKEAEKAGEVK